MEMSDENDESPKLGKAEKEILRDLKRDIDTTLADHLKDLKKVEEVLTIMVEEKEKKEQQDSIDDFLDKKIKRIEQSKRIKEAIRGFIKNYETCEECGYRYRGTFKSYCGLCENCGADKTDNVQKEAMRKCINELKEITGYTFEQAKKIFKYGLYKIKGN